jgi:hypothetical protein
MVEVLTRRLEAAKAEGKSAALIFALEEAIEDLEHGRVPMRSAPRSFDSRAERDDRTPDHSSSGS